MPQACRRLLPILITALALPIATLQAQGSDELLVPVEESVAARLGAKTNSGIRQQLYPAKRHRFVEINFEVLERAGAEFSITPFDDLTIQMSTLEFADPASREQLRYWQGKLLSPTLRGFPDMPQTLNIRSGDHQVSWNVARRIEAERNEANSMGPVSRSVDAPATNDRARGYSKVQLKTLSGQLFVPGKGARIVIQPAEDDPRYHVVYEYDETKLRNSAHGPDTDGRGERMEKFMRELEAERAEEAAKQNK